MMSNRDWFVLVMSVFGLYFVVAACAVKTFRYKYGGFPVPRLVGGIVYALVGLFCFGVAIKLALQP
jgi:hypothetical protein